MKFEEAVNQTLCKIHQVLIDIRDKKQVAQKTTYQGWTAFGLNGSWFLQKHVIFTGTTMTINLDLLEIIQSLQKREVLPEAFQINRIVQIFGDATARTFSVRAYDNSAFSDYVELSVRTANISTSSITQLGNEYKYPAELRIQFSYSDYTVDKTLDIRIQVDEI